MIDVSKCVLESQEWFYGNEVSNTVYYFTYPKEYADDFGVSFQPFDRYGEVVSLTVALEKGDDGGFVMGVSPKVVLGYDVVDVDWQNLDIPDNATIDKLLQLAHTTIPQKS